MIALRVDLPHSHETEFLNLINEFSQYYIIGLEISKKSNKEHIHAVIKTTKHIDTIRRKIRKFYNLGKMGLYVKQVNDPVKTIAYTIKDGNYNIHWDDNDQIEEAHQYMAQVKEEIPLSMTQKVFNWMEKQDYNNFHTITDAAMMVINYFKEKKLNYPQPHLMKQILIKYYVDTTHYTLTRKANIIKLYGLQDAFITEKNI